VLDPFVGSGTVAVAAIRMQRRIVACELERKYFDIAVKRCKDELGRLPLIEKPQKLRQSTLFESEE